MSQFSTEPEYTVEEPAEMLDMENKPSCTNRDFEQVEAEVRQLLTHSIRVLNMQDAITVRLQVLQQSLQEQV